MLSCLLNGSITQMRWSRGYIVGPRSNQCLFQQTIWNNHSSICSDFLMSHLKFNFLHLKNIVWILWTCRSNTWYRLSSGFTGYIHSHPTHMYVCAIYVLIGYLYITHSFRRPGYPSSLVIWEFRDVHVCLFVMLVYVCVCVMLVYVYIIRLLSLPGNSNRIYVGYNLILSLSSTFRCHYSSSYTIFYYLFNENRRYILYI